MTSTTPVHDGEGQRPYDDRLDSWKEIAAFLHRDVRTVQRWEKQSGLPVHRPADSRLRTAYAFRSELEAWWREQDVATVGGAARDADPPTAAIPTRWWVSAIVLATVTAGLGIAAWVAITREQPATASAPPDITLLLSRFVDETGDPVLAKRIEETVLHGLRRQRGISITPPARVTRMLRFMRNDAAAPLAAPTAREVAMRDGQIAFIVAARLHRADSQYFVDVQAITPLDGGVAASIEPAAADRRALAAAVEGEIDAFAARLVRAAPRAGPPETLEPVTTASLAALRLYSSAIQAGNRRQWGAAEMLARRAVAADDQFASAYALLARAMRNQGHPRQHCLPAIERAVALSGSVSDAENYLISASYHALAGNLSESIAAYEAVLRLQPKNGRALDQLIAVYSRAGRFKDAIDLSITRATSAPDDFYANVRAAHALIVWKGDRAGATPYVDRARQLAAGSEADERPWWSAWLSALPVFDAWIKNDCRGALDALGISGRTLDSRVGVDRDALATSIGSAYLAFGKLRDADHAFRRAASPHRQMNLALLALTAGRPDRARAWLRQVRDGSALRPVLFARAGLADDAEKGLAALGPSDYEEGIADVARGMLAARKGKDDDAMTALRRGVERLRFSGEPEYFLGAAELARILRARGEFRSAVEWLAQAAAQRRRTYASRHWAGAYWIQVSSQLASLYRETGEREQADAIDGTLRPVLQEADADHPAAALFRLARRP